MIVSSEVTTRRSTASAWHWLNDRGIAPALVLAVMVLALAVFAPSFASAKSIASVLDQSAILILLALAQGLIILLGRIDLSNAALTSFAAVLLAQWLGPWGWASLLAILVVTAIIGALQGWIHVFFQVPSFVVTLGTLGIVSGAALLLSGASTVLVTENKEMLAWLYERPNGIPIAFLAALAIGLIMTVVFARSVWGKEVIAVGLNERAAAYSGINTGRLIVLQFALAGLLGGVASLFLVGQLGAASPAIANSYLLPGIAAVIVGGVSIAGGVGGPGRVILGALIISLLRVGLDLLGVPDAYQPIVYGLVTIIAIAITVNRSRMVTVT